MATDTVESAEPEASLIAAVAEAKEVATTEVLETMRKGDLLNLCREKGIAADKRMKKVELIELLSRRS
jgi:hypothetical protein